MLSPSSTGPAPATTLARHGHLRRHDLSLERRRELLRLIEPEPEFSQADRLAALNTSNLGLGRHAGPCPGESIQNRGVLMELG